MTFDPVHCAALRIFAATACCAGLLACTEQTAESGSTAPEQSNLAATEGVDPAASFDESKTEQIDDSAAAPIPVRRNDPAVINFEGFGPAQFGGVRERSICRLTCGNELPLRPRNRRPTTGGQGIAGSNTVSPTKEKPRQSFTDWRGFFFAL